MRQLLSLVLGAVTISLPIAAHAAETTAYNYDAKGRLVAVSKTGSANNGVTVAYSYDRADNRTNVVVNGATGSVAAGGRPPVAPCPQCSPTP